MPAQQTDETILPPRRFNLPSNRLNPGLFVSDLLVLRSIENPGSQVQQHVRLRRGLNILWADPKSGVRKEGERGSGHAAGKTTFCRLIRYLLGERHFGPEDHEARIRTKFINGWVVGRVELDGSAWLVGRAFSGHTDSFALRDVPVETFLREGLPPDSPRDGAFQQELHRLFVTPLERATFPGDHGRPIMWAHLLPWYARDQESRLADIAAWRSKLSHAKSPEADSDERHFLMRLVLGLLSEDETDEYDEHERLNQTRRELEHLLPLMKDRVRQQFRGMRALVGPTGKSLLGELLVAAADESLNQQEGRIQTEERQLPSETDVANARMEATEAARKTAKGEARIAALERQEKKLGSNLGELEAERIQARLDEANGKLPPPRGYCGVPIDKARGVCRLAQEQPVSMAEGYIFQQINAQEEKLKGELVAAQRELAEARSHLEFLKGMETAASAAHEALLAHRNRALTAIIRARRDIENQRTQVAEAKRIVAALNRAETKWQRTNAGIKKSLKGQESARKGRDAARQDISALFDLVLLKLLWAGVSGKLRFRGRSLELHAEDSGHVATSGALEIMKIIGFDLSAMIWSMEGNGHHPRFLMHDSPREADMEADTYRHVFPFVHRLESFFPQGIEPNFQYIITTTEPPPVDLQKVGACLICEPLDASVRDGRFLKEDL